MLFQNIDVPVSSNYIHFKNDLDVQTANGLNLDVDFVHTHFDEVIEAPKTFSFETEFQSLRTNGTVNGMDLNSFKVEVNF